MTGVRSYTTKIWRQPSSIGFSSAGALSTSMDPPGEPVISTWKRPCQKIQNGSEFPELVAQNFRNPHEWLPASNLYPSLNFPRGFRMTFFRMVYFPFCLLMGAALCGCASGGGNGPGGDDFSLAVTPSSQMVNGGANATFSVAVSAIGAFTGNVSLAAIGLPAGATASFGGGPITGSGTSTLIISTTVSTPYGSSILTITGTSGGLSHSATMNLAVVLTPAQIVAQMTL